MIARITADRLAGEAGDGMHQAATALPGSRLSCFGVVEAERSFGGEFLADPLGAREEYDEEEEFEAEEGEDDDFFEDDEEEEFFEDDEEDGDDPFLDDLEDEDDDL